LTLGASAVQIGTGFLRCPEAGLDPAWADALAMAQPEGRWSAARSQAAPAAASPPLRPCRCFARGAGAGALSGVQRGLTQAMRVAAGGDVDRMQAWPASQRAWHGPNRPASWRRRCGRRESVAGRVTGA